MTSEKQLDMVLSRVKETLSELQTYPEWVQAWEEFHTGLQFAPAMSAYYIFTNLLSPEQQMYDAQACQLTDRTFPSPSKRDRYRAAMMRLVHSRSCPPPIRKATDAAFCHHCAQTVANCRHSFFLCPTACPKELVYGACGGSDADGTCEFGHAKCFFHRVLAVAAKRHELDLLEKGPDT